MESNFFSHSIRIKTQRHGDAEKITLSNLFKFSALPGPLRILRLCVFFFILSPLFSCNSTIEEKNCFSDEKRKVCLRPNGAFFQLVNYPTNSDSTTWSLDYPAEKILYEDISNNGEKNILVTVIKATRFDSVVRKRLFVYKFYEEEIRPLWLGSRLGMPLEDFFVVEENGEYLLKTIELEKEGDFAMALYRWDSFGFEFIEYLERHKSLEELTTQNETH